MAVLGILALVALAAGQLWFAYEVWQREDLTWAILLLLIPFPLVGLYVWYRAGWDSCYRAPGALYFGGYLFEIVLRSMS